MRNILNKIEQLDCGWNVTPLKEETFHKLCKRFRIVVQEMPLQVSGFYYSVHGRHFIAIDRKLGPRQKLFVMFHEFAHFLFHAPDGGATANFHGIGKKTRKEAEADTFALCALLPRTLIENCSAQELIEEDGFPEKMVADRFDLYRMFGI